MKSEIIAEMNVSTITENHGRLQKQGKNNGTKQEEGKFEGGHGFGAERQRASMTSRNQRTEERRLERIIGSGLGSSLPLWRIL